MGSFRKVLLQSLLTAFKIVVPYCCTCTYVFEKGLVLLYRRFTSSHWNCRTHRSNWRSRIVIVVFKFNGGVLVMNGDVAEISSSKRTYSAFQPVRGLGLELSYSSVGSAFLKGIFCFSSPRLRTRLVVLANHAHGSDQDYHALWLKTRLRKKNFPFSNRFTARTRNSVLDNRALGFESGVVCLVAGFSASKGIIQPPNWFTAPSQELMLAG